MAADKGHEAIVRLLLDVPNIDITIRSIKDGHTAMSAAQARGHKDIIQLLQDFDHVGCYHGLDSCSLDVICHRTVFVAQSYSSKAARCKIP
ncbi:hypothetical protein BKA70DRAFT_1302895, partial [Coprinopsis sp. MPI-PUGE-AT-0042]